MAELLLSKLAEEIRLVFMRVGSLFQEVSSGSLIQLNSGMMSGSD